MTHEEELTAFVDKLEAFAIANTPSFLTSNSYFVGVVPGHNLDLLQISFDFKINRTDILLSETPNVLKDPSRPDLTVVESNEEYENILRKVVKIRKDRECES